MKPPSRLTRRQPLTREHGTADLVRRRAFRAISRQASPDEVLARALVVQRSGGRCEVCSDVAGSWAHRVAQGQGGPWDVRNGLALCGTGTTGCHGWCHANPAAATAAGLMLQSWQDYTSEPVFLPRRGWVRLADAPRYERLTVQPARPVLLPHGGRWTA